MKGIVLTEFLEMIEQEFGLEILDNIILKSELPSPGIYTSVGTYDFMEMQNLISDLGQATGIPPDELLYGQIFL